MTSETIEVIDVYVYRIGLMKHEYSMASPLES
jgi:ABC-type polysaccharide transport system permease subunit